MAQGLNALAMGQAHFVRILIKPLRFCLAAASTSFSWWAQNYCWQTGTSQVVAHLWSVTRY